MPMSEFRVHRWTSHDGLSLYSRVYDEAPPQALAVLCLPGLTRNSRDFERLASHLAPHFRVICPDLRGRGFSARDPNWRNYHPSTYMGDLYALLRGLDITRVAIIGTSLGGLLAMMLPSVVRGAIVGVVLNDIGPEIDPAGAARIAGYAGRLPPVSTWAEAVAQLREVYGSALPGLPDSMWIELTRRSYREDADGVPVLDVDSMVGEALRKSSSRTPDLWPLFAALGSIPMLAIRGAHSDILSEATFARMQREKPDLVRLEVANRGHMPLLDETECLAGIDTFLERLNQR
jgi:pimeloyl-ACP methyl ester carboxylesterase